MADANNIPASLLAEDAERLDAIAAGELGRVDVDSVKGAQLASLSFATEARVLGALMLVPALWAQVSRIIAPLDFEVPFNQEAYRAVGELASSDRPFDPVSVALHLQAAGRLGPEAMGRLSGYVADTHAPANAVSFATQVRKRALARQAQEAAKAFAIDLEAGEVSIDEALQAHQARLAPLHLDIAAERPKLLPRDFMNWRALQHVDPPEREWAIDEWLGMGYVTLLAGAGGLGKTLIAQTMATGLAVGRGFCGHAPKPRRVLMLAGEDEQDELHRRQIAICQWMGITFESIADNLFLQSYKRVDFTLAQAGPNGVLTKTPMMAELREMIGDLRIDYLMLDSSARVYGGNESDRHQVTKFCTWLEWAAGPAGALLLAHPAKVEGSEYSGSTAWEGSVRTRLFLSRKPPEPDTKPDPDVDGVPEELEGTRYLCRRKANYTDRAHAKLLWSGGLLVPEPPRVAVATGPQSTFSQRYGKVKGADGADQVILQGVDHFAKTGRHASKAPTSSDYIISKLEALRMTEGYKAKDLKPALVRMLEASRIVEIEVPRANGQKRQGLALAETGGNAP